MSRLLTGAAVTAFRRRPCQRSKYDPLPGPDPSEVVCLVNVRDDDNFLAGVHARVMGPEPVGRKVETNVRISRYFV
jgi:hypothetical protein